MRTQFRAFTWKTKSNICFEPRSQAISFFLYFSPYIFTLNLINFHKFHILFCDSPVRAEELRDLSSERFCSTFFEFCGQQSISPPPLLIGSLFFASTVLLLTHTRWSTSCQYWFNAPVAYHQYSNEIRIYMQTVRSVWTSDTLPYQLAVIWITFHPSFPLRSQDPS